MVGAIIYFYLIVVFPGKEPIFHKQEVPTLAECAAAVAHVLGQPSQKALEEGAIIQASCVIHIPERKGA